MTVAILYCDLRGPYREIEDVELWGLPDRDADEYAGPHPVVAHPPCGPWGCMKALSRESKRHGLLAVAATRQWGGVLEHPLGSGLFRALCLPIPGGIPDEYGGRTYDLDQVHWGHRCRKRTWLYCVRCGPLPEAPYPGARPTHQIWARSGPGHFCASKEIRRRTPPLLARALVEMAREAKPWD